MIDLKGITFNIIIFTTIALMSVVIFLVILNSIIPNFIGRGLCKLYQIFLSLPLPKQLKPPIPGCSMFPRMERLRLSEGSSNTLTNYLVKCWEKSEEGKLGQTFICYELFLKEIPTPFNEGDITTGSTVPILWKINPPSGLIEGEDITIIIKYNAETQRVEVI